MIRRLRRPTILAPTRHREYRLLFGAQVVSNLGDWLDILALVALVLYRWGLGAGAWGAVLTAINVPGPLIGPFAGVWVDRWNRRTVMVVCDLARAAIVLGLVWAPNLITVVLLIAAVSSLSAFFQPAQQAAIRLTVPEEDLLAANALSQLSDNGARLVGPALGGLVVLVAGARGAFVIDAASFLISAAFLSRLVLPATSPAPAQAAARSFRRDLRLGLSFIARSPLLRLTVLAMVVATFLARCMDTLVFLVVKAIGVDAGLQGFVMTTVGVGYVVAALAVGQFGQRVPALSLVGAGAVLVGAVVTALGATVYLGLRGVAPIALGGFLGSALLGIGFATVFVAYGYILQRETPPELMGRVSATTRSLIGIAPIVAPVLATLLADRLGLGPAFALIGLVFVIAGAVVVAVGREPAVAPVPKV